MQFDPRPYKQYKGVTPDKIAATEKNRVNAIQGRRKSDHSNIKS